MTLLEFLYKLIDIHTGFSFGVVLLIFIIIYELISLISNKINSVTEKENKSDR